MRHLSEYARSCLGLIVAPRVIPAIVGPLPRVYQRDIFWRDIPSWISVGENLTRMIVVVLPALMPLRIATGKQRIGLALYLTGVVVYWGAWQLAGSPWISHPFVFTAPAWTPLVWLAGISLIGDRLYCSLSYRPWMYMAASLLFLLFHNWHAWIVWTRMHP